MTEELKVIIKAETQDLKNACKSASDEVKGMASKTNTAVDGLQKKLASLGKAVIAAFSVKAIVGFGKTCVEAAADVAAANSAFEATLGENADKMTAKLKQLGDETGITYTRMTEASTLYYNKWLQNGYDADKAMDMTIQSLNLGADAAAYYNMSLDDANEHIKSFVNGNLNAGDAIGISTNATQIASWAAEQLGIDYDSASEAQKQMVRQEYIDYMYEASGVMGQASREGGAYENVLGNLKEAWRQFMATIGEPILQNIVIPAMQWLTQLLMDLQPVLQTVFEKIQEGIAWVKQFAAEHQGLIEVLKVLGIGIAAAVVAFGAISAAMGIATAASTAFGAVMAFITSPIGIAVAAIGAIVAIIVVCAKHWDEIKEKVSEVVGKIKDWCGELADKVKEKFEAIKTAISEKVEAIKTAVSEKFNAVKEKVSSAMSAAKESASNSLANMKAAFEQHGGGIKGVAAAAMEGVKGYFSTGYAFLNSLTGGKLEEIRSAFASKLDAVKSAVSSKLEAVKSKFSSIFESAKSIVSNAIEKIKSFFNFEWSLPKIKLPHFSISGSFSLSPPSIPHISVSWYAKGGVFDVPTLFTYGDGQIGGLGEHGAEAIVPLENDTQWLDKIAERLNGGGGGVIQLVVNDKVFGQVAVDSINSLTRSTGRLQLQVI